MSVEIDAISKEQDPNMVCRTVNLNLGHGGYEREGHRQFS